MGQFLNEKEKKRSWLVLIGNNKLNANRKISYVSTTKNKLYDKLDSKNKMTQLGLNIFGIFKFLNFFGIF